MAEWVSIESPPEEVVNPLPIKPVVIAYKYKWRDCLGLEPRLKCGGHFDFFVKRRLFAVRWLGGSQRDRWTFHQHSMKRLPVLINDRTELCQLSNRRTTAPRLTIHKNE